MGKQKTGVAPSVKQWVERWRDATLTVYQGEQRKNVCFLSSVHTGVGTFSGAKANPEFVMYYINTKYGVDIPDQMMRAYSVKVVVYNILDLAGINARILFKECTSSRRARREVLQQLAEELRAEYIEGKGTVAVGTRWAAVEAPTAAADTDMEAVLVQKSCNGTKLWTLEMPHARVWGEQR